MRARFAMNRACIVLPVSSMLKQAIEDYGIKARFHIVPNVVNSNIFYPLPEKAEDNCHKKIKVI